MRDTSIAGTSLEPSATTLDDESCQDTRGNDLEHSNNAEDWIIRIEDLNLNDDELVIPDIKNVEITHESHVRHDRVQRLKGCRSMLYASA